MCKMQQAAGCNGGPKLEKKQSDTCPSSIKNLDCKYVKSGQPDRGRSA